MIPLLYVALIYCLPGNPDACVTRRPIAEGFQLEGTCLQAAEEIAASREEIAEAAFEHPRYRLARISCARATGVPS